MCLRPLFVVVLLAGCATPLPRGDLVLRPVAKDAVPRAVVGASYQVRVLGDSQLDGKLKVQPDGTVTVPLCGSVKVLGLTVGELESRISQCLEPWLRDPSVSVRVLDSGQSVVVLGDLAGRVRWEPGLSLISLLLQLGGEGIGKQVDVVQISRGEHHASVSVSAIASGESPDVALEPGDLLRIECSSKCVAVSPRSVPAPHVETERVTVVLSVDARNCAEGMTGCADLGRLLDEVLPTVGLAPRSVRTSANVNGTTVEVSAPTAGEAQARCTALVLAARAAMPQQANPARKWAQMELLQTREHLAALGDSLRTLPLEGPCADETTMPGLKACVLTRLSRLGAQPETKDCTSGLMCTVAAKWLDSRRQFDELASRYGPEHPVLRAAGAQRDELQKWFGRQRQTEISALNALIARLPKAGSAQKARVENVLAQLESPTFDLADGAAEDLPGPLRFAALEYGTVALKRTGLLARLLEKHPEVVAVEAQLALIRDAARKLVPLEVELLRDQLAHPRGATEDPRAREAARQRENLLRAHELLDRLAGSPELTVVQPCR